MTILVTADLHFGDNPRDAYRFKLFKILEQLVYDHQVDEILILGDLTEEKDRHSAWLVNTIVEGLYQLAKGPSITILRGNHDYVDINSPFFAFLGRVKGIRWITKPTELACDLGGLLFLPHTNKPERDWTPWAMGQYDWIFAHHTFEGADVGHGRKLNGINTDIFPKDNVISGDIHVPQKLGPVEYVGAPYTVDFGDDYEGRVLILDGKKRKSIPIIMPQKKLVEASDLKDLTRVKNVYAGDILKVRYFLSADQQQRWPEIQTAIREWSEKHGYVLHNTQPVVATNRLGGETPKRKILVRSDQQLLESYAKQRGVDPRTLKTGLTLMGKV